MKKAKTDQFSNIAPLFQERAKRLIDLGAEFTDAVVAGDVPGMRRALGAYRVALRTIEESFDEILEAFGK